MAKQITQLPVAASVAASDVFPLDQSGTTKQATLTAIAAGLPAGTGTGGLVRQTNPDFNSGVRITGSIQSSSDAAGFNLGAGASAIGAPGSGAFVQLYGGAHPTQAGKMLLGSSTLTHSAFDASGNLGVGTLSPAARLHVNGILRVDGAGAKIEFTDTFGSNPAFVQQGDNNFVFYGTNSTGGGRGILSCIMRSDTEPLNVAVPLRIGTGSSISAVYTTSLNSFAPAAIAASGGFQSVDVTITGVDGSCSTLVECSGGMSNNSIILKSNVVATNTVRIYWINPTAASVTLSAANYRISAIKFA